MNIKVAMTGKCEQVCTWWISETHKRQKECHNHVSVFRDAKYKCGGAYV